MTKLFVVVEGYTEQRFIRGALREHLPHLDPQAIIVETSRAAGTIHRGGGDWTKWLENIQLTLGQHPQSIVTTMFDLYGLPSNFPDHKAPTPTDTIAYAGALELAMGKVIADERFVPNLIRHEFETLVLAALPELGAQLAPAEASRLEQLHKLVLETGPEEINCGKTTAPSKRLQQAGVNYHKLTRGVPAVRAAGIAKICTSCPRFRAWIKKLERI